MRETSPRVIVIAGPNGAGKLTLAPHLLRDTFGLLEFVNADSIALGLSAFRPEGAAVEAGRVMLRRLRERASALASFAFETALSTRSYAPWIAALRDGGYNFHLIFLWLCSAELAAQRVKDRAAGTTCRSKSFAGDTRRACETSSGCTGRWPIRGLCTIIPNLTG